MTNKLIQLLITFCILSISLPASATFMHHNSGYNSKTSQTSFSSGYTLDDATSIVTGGGLQWLQWDETVGMTISQAVTKYSADGWRIATSTEMSNMLNTFFNINANSWLDVDVLFKSNRAEAFIDLFGITDIKSFFGYTVATSSKALYLGTSNALSFVTVIDFLLKVDVVKITSQPLNCLTYMINSGIAFVRDVSSPISYPTPTNPPASPTQVPEPGTLLLFIAALIFVVKRNKFIRG